MLLKFILFVLAIVLRLGTSMVIDLAFLAVQKTDRYVETLKRKLREKKKVPKKWVNIKLKIL